MAALYIFVTVFTAAIGSIFFSGPSLLFLLLGGAVRPFSDSAKKVPAEGVPGCNASVAWLWLSLQVWILETMFGIEMKVSGDSMQSLQSQLASSPSIILSNHYCRLDWMFLWIFAFHTGVLAELKIILKAGLRSVPFLGWAMQCFHYIFLKRNREEDIAALRNSVGHLCRQKACPPCFLIFPEGTDLSPSNIEKSNTWGESRGLEKKYFSLHPKVAGFQTIADCMRSHSEEANVVDITIMYDNYVPANGHQRIPIFQVRFPRCIHVHARLYKLSALSPNKAAQGNWLRERFREKERVLSSFYLKGRDSINARKLLQRSESRTVSMASWTLLVGLPWLLVVAALGFCFFNIPKLMVTIFLVNSATFVVLSMIVERGAVSLELQTLGA